MSRQAVITGIGVVTPAGIGIHDFWSNMVSGQSFISPITRFDTTRFACKVAGTIANFDPREFLDPRTIVQTDRWTHFDLASTKQALVDAQLHIDQEDPTRI